MTGLRHRFAFAAAAAATVGALLALGLLVGVDDGGRGGEGLYPAEVALVVTSVVLSLLGAVALTRYAVGAMSQRGAIASVVALGVAGLLGGAATWYLPYAAALLAGCAIAAGEPLPPADPDDDRMSRPMPRGDDGY
ncbi:MAG TPA: hypothetical protein VNA14_11945 [Mycobacteriales bacterium]|nr:hypothetical protein [Mycobacteriales bacterium]